jgi:hypothetical protein
MVHLKILFIIALFAAAAVSAQKSPEEVLIQEGWIPIKLIDVFPDAKIDGVPANDSVIYSYEAPAGASSAHLKRAANLLSDKDATHSFSPRGDGDPQCYTSGSWVFQNQLYSAKDTFCSDASTHGLDNGHGYAAYKNWWYNDATSTWTQFTRSDGSTTSVFFWINVNPGFYFNWDVCFNGFWTLINTCHGSNPDSAGGMIYNYNYGQIHVQIDPSD